MYRIRLHEKAKGELGGAFSEELVNAHRAMDQDRSNVKMVVVVGG